MPSVSVIGLGAMGSGIAQTLLESGCKVSVWNRSQAKVDALVSSGAIACTGPGDALDANTYVIVCLSDYQVWQQVIASHSLARHFQDTFIIQLTTGTIDDVQAHASFIRDQGGHIVDGDTIPAGGMGMVAFANVQPGEFTASVVPPDGVDCTAFPSGGEMPAAPVAANQVTVVTFHCR